MTLAGDLDIRCPICKGELPKGREICCYDEDRYLLTELRRFIRARPKHAVSVGEIVEYLYGRLQPYATERGIPLDEIDPDDVFTEIEKRILRWIARKDVSVNAVAGLGICESCGAMIMRGRTLCNSCARTKEIASNQPTSSLPASGPVSRGMHFKVR
jgi:hypothetical protein